MKLTKNNIAKGLALTTGVLWVLCSLVVALLPEFSRTVTEWWMYGMELGSYSITWGSFIFGGVTLVASAWLAGYILGWSLELSGSRKGK